MTVKLGTFLEKNPIDLAFGLLENILPVIKNIDTVKALNSALLSSGKALISGQKLGDQLFLCSKSPQ